VELPGLDKKSIHVEVKENVLTLKGERKFVKGIKEEQYHRIERYYGKFIRSFNLPSSVEKDKAEARFKDGILRVTLPKSQKIKPQQVTVEVR
jgi:HSP20 family protein